METTAEREDSPVNPTRDLSEPGAGVGRLFMAGMPGTELDGDTRKLIRDHGLGGIILFARNIENPLQLAALCRDLSETARASHGRPLFLAVDQEGGPVARLREPFTRFPGNTAMGKDPAPEDRAREFARVTAKEMALVGLNMDLAPVVDVPEGTPEKHLRGRTFSEDPRVAARLGSLVVRGLQENGIMSVAKHFPGLGKAPRDPHHHLPAIAAPEDEIATRHLPPFRACIEAGVSGIMTSHAVYPALDPGGPATLSKRILTGLLRDRLGFQGLILTDDLEMGAISGERGVPDAAADAFAAGADILLICRDQDRVLESIKRLRQKLLRGEIPPARLHASLDRIRVAEKRFLKDAKKVSMERVRAYFGL